MVLEGDDVRSRGDNSRCGSLNREIFVPFTATDIEREGRRCDCALRVCDLHKVCLVVITVVLDFERRRDRRGGLCRLGAVVGKVLHAFNSTSFGDGNGDEGILISALKPL